MGEQDHATYNFLAWYVSEQVEEEANAEELLSKVKLTDNNASLMYNLDASLAARKFVDPFPQTEGD
jgi:ferritin